MRLFRSFTDRGRTVDETVALVALEEKRRAQVGKLSGGQRQRLALACALVGDPELLFLDEPTTGLDPQGRRKVWEIVADFAAGRGTVVLTTHYMEEAARLCDRVAILDHGRVIALGTPAALVATLGADQIVELRTSAGDIGAGAGEAGPTTSRWATRSPPCRACARLARRDGAFVLTVGDIGAALPAVLAELARRGAGLESLSTRQPTLDDLFVSLTGRALRDE